MSRKKTHKKKKAGSKLNRNLISERTLIFLNDNLSRAYSIRQLMKKFNLKGKKSKNELLEVLFILEEKGKVSRLRNNSYRSTKEPKIFTGTVDFVNPRVAYIISESLEQDAKVDVDDLRYALDGDKVEFVLTQTLKPGRQPRGKVINILERKRDSFVGRIEIFPRYAFVIADNRRMHYDIFVKHEDLNKARHNDKVIVEITQWPDHDKNPEGKVTRVLGRAGENDAEIHSIMAEFDLPFSFPENVEKFAAEIKDEIPKQEIKQRRDFREITTFTIDPEDAKDFDDALSIQKLENGNFEIGVHIADVTHYMEKGSILDREAFERATSVYLVDRTIPMLPERLSNELCSLRPNEEKLTFSAVFELNEKAEVVKEWFGRTIIYSDKRFTYEEAQEVIDSKSGEFAEELETLNKLALALRKNRFKHGAVNFETTEVKFKLDENGKPLGVIPKVRQDAHKLIEDFMLLANKKVAEFIYKMDKGKNRKTFVYRTHDNPDPEKLEVFSVFASKFGHRFNLHNQSISKSLNTLIDDIEGKPEQNVLETLAIRTMAKAKYTTEEKGHFGLAYDHYTHFTSPIRRYPDVMVHRLLYHYLNGENSVTKDDYEDKCLHASEREKRAADAERASIKYKQVEYMESVDKKVFDGIVSGVTEWGVYVEIIETKCEGMVRMADMQDDYYDFDEKNFCVVGQRSKKVISLGDEVKVSVKQTDIDRRIIDLFFE
ncbi:ribonuclease R [Fulvivirgaceae bacterium BMA10]|uniref:Ribonuclease R n=1 Tax=Splendidivirga corallicola TaxID=3051826 RepID=A0ABT8KS09_9BACT|nr:ribonuclease R [Fulvivirgaceae bacterium BMA10]